MATTTTKARTARPKQPAPRTTIRRIGGDLYWVSSASHPGTGHQVTPQSCTCPASRHGRPDCRHRALVRVYHAWRTEQAAQAQDGPAQQPAAATEAPREAGTAQLAPLWRHFE